MLKYLKGYTKQSILAPLFKMFEALLDLFVPLVMADIINAGIESGDTKYVLQRCLFLVALGLLGLLCSVTAQYFAAQAAVGYSCALRRDMFRHIGSLDYATADRLGASTLVTRMTSDINQVQTGLNMFLRLFLRSPFIVFGSLVMAFTISLRAALIFAAAIPIVAIIVVAVTRVTMPGYGKVQTGIDNITGLTRENLSGARVIRAFGREPGEVSRFEAQNAELAGRQRRVGRVSALMNPLVYVAVNLAVVAILNTGAVQINLGELRQGDVIALVNYMAQVLVELVKLTNLVVTISRSLACAKRVKQILAEKPGMTYPQEKIEIIETQPAVSFSEVSLSYGGENSLTGISFTALAGQTIGITGGTGSGKTSLVNLIPRFFDATSGSVKLFGAPVADYPLEQLRELVGIVPQRARLFKGTIRSNLLWGNENADDAELWAALEVAQAAEFVKKKPRGLDETVEQGGRNLSGGQRQRLTIARALVKKSKILIMDDSASALDLATDAALRKALHENLGDTTVFIVSQRAASIMGCDKILVLDDGELVGRGSHAELLEGCGIYREIYESQFKKGGETK